MQAEGSVDVGRVAIAARFVIGEIDLHRAHGVGAAEIERRRQRYLAGRPHPDVKGRTVIVVDDGIATGATTRAALQAMRESKAGKIVLAVPVAPDDTLEKLRGECDDIVCLESHTFFGAIGAYYADFSQVSDDEVIALLDRTAAPTRPQ